MTSRTTQMHYAWIISLTGTAVLFSCLGLGRFSIGMLLPSMGSSLELNYSQMGLISTGNFVGYMISVVIAGMAARRITARWTITAGLALVGGSMMLIGQARGFVMVLFLYFATGVGSGLANVPMMGLVSHWFFKDVRGRAAGIMLSGNGLAIIFAGFFIPWINRSLGSEGWRTAWLVLGILSFLICGVAGFFLRNRPDEKKLTALGTAPAAGSVSSAGSKSDSGNQKTLIYLGCIYSLFGATYVVYATFIVTTLVNERGFGESTAGTFWAVVGGLSLFSGPLFGWISDRLGRRTGMMVVYALFCVSYALAAARLPNAFLYISIFIFGLAVWSIPTIMSAAVGDYMGPNRAVKAFGFITLFFGAGQITGPAVAGFLADMTGTFSIAFWLCSVLTAIAVVMAYFLKQPSH